VWDSLTSKLGLCHVLEIHTSEALHHFWLAII
jgi:hypothetical protein